MRQIIELQLTPKQSTDEDSVRKIAARKLKTQPVKISHLIYLKRSIDARSKQIWIRLKTEVFIDENPPAEEISFRKEYPFVGNCPPVIIVGAGPAGLFAALRLIEKGLRPVIIE